jgi:hypothetical protein
LKIQNPREHSWVYFSREFKIHIQVTVGEKTKASPMWERGDFEGILRCVLFVQLTYESFVVQRFCGINYSLKIGCRAGQDISSLYEMETYYRYHKGPLSYLILSQLNVALTFTFCFSMIYFIYS